MLTVEDMVRREIGSCVSSLVSTLAIGGHGDITVNGGPIRNPRLSAIAPLMELADQASELCSPVLDYEEAARQEGWKTSDSGQTFINERNIDPETKQCEASEADPRDATGWEDLCNEFSIDPYEREIFEHWIVSPWLADKLEAEGERIDKDFAGLCVWGRTTTGQAISMDYVMERIHSNLVKA